MESALRRNLPPDLKLIETFGFDPALGFQNLDLHLSRMEKSAQGFGIDFDRNAAQHLLSSVSGTDTRRCRMSLKLNGKFELQVFPISSTVSAWRVMVAKDRLRSDDRWLQVKTTERQLYDNARANLPNGVDELIFLNERGEICEGTITNVFADFGQGLITPPLTCGLLPGVLRQKMLDAGEAAEAILTERDIKKAQRLFVGNSLRGLIRAHLV
ncbi:aminotransferase class IV family protein [Pseudohalocynthiibacter aestuariivivens]|uniref:Probable branched-chain-amino-acid aminotransferase n=1 Tax=Pseudohalocynthiibacter aestuariivivens TaxID=1591409 RepID=A0ABV5JD06_9RHOB|nr:aminotransferase class IV family protein [Pseudohalocynthiibacter aestuariivivens]